MRDIAPAARSPTLNHAAPRRLSRGAERGANFDASLPAPDDAPLPGVESDASTETATSVAALALRGTDRCAGRGPAFNDRQRAGTQ